MKQFIITFACVPGTGKSALASYLSVRLGLPIFSNDAIRDEVHQDQDLRPELDIEEFEKRRSERLDELLKTKRSFIYDASVDRRWAEASVRVKAEGYQVFVISYNLSKEFSKRLYTASPNRDVDFEAYFEQHEKFLQKYKDVINISINDQTYPKRRELTLKAITDTLNI